jgi:hypothetical protein
MKQERGKQGGETTSETRGEMHDKMFNETCMKKNEK